MRRWFRFSSRGEAQDTLLADLDALAAGGNRHASAFARRVRRGDVEGCLAEVAPHVARCATFATTTPVIGALVRYERAAHGHDLAPPAADIRRARAAASAPSEAIADALARRDAAVARARARANRRTLAALRAESGRS